MQMTLIFGETHRYTGTGTHYIRQQQTKKTVFIC